MGNSAGNVVGNSAGNAAGNSAGNFAEYASGNLAGTFPKPFLKPIFKICKNHLDLPHFH